MDYFQVDHDFFFFFSTTYIKKRLEFHIRCFIQHVNDSLLISSLYSLFCSVFSNSVRVTSYTLTGLQAYNEYEFRVIAINNAGQTLSDWASVFTREDGK